MQILISVVIFAMLARVLLPLFVNPEDSRLYMMSLLITEPVIIPVRLIFSKLNIGQNSPFDWAFTASYIILIIINSSLPVL